MAFSRFSPCDAFFVKHVRPILFPSTRKISMRWMDFFPRIWISINQENERKKGNRTNINDDNN